MIKAPMSSAVGVISNNARQQVSTIDRRFSVYQFLSLAAAIAFCNAIVPCELYIPAGRYNWPAERPRSGLSLRGDGGPFPFTQPVEGTRISGLVEQASGFDFHTQYRGIMFEGGLNIRKQHTRVADCAVAGLGLSFDRNGDGAAYYCTAENVQCWADQGGTALTIGSDRAFPANANNLRVSIHTPVDGRGVYFAARSVGNRVEATIDLTEPGNPTAGAIRSLVFDDGIENVYVPIYHEQRLTADTTDGARFVIGPNARRSTIGLKSDLDSFLINPAALGKGHTIVSGIGPL